jgi:hemerythrin-like metal-binding protein
MESKIWRLVWDPKMSVGIPEVDADHLRCISLIEGLNHAILERMDSGEISQRLRLVLSDADAHFAHEDELFRHWRYPDSETHAALHRHVLKDCRELLANAAGLDINREWVRAALGVKGLLVDHLLIDDMKYHDYFVTRSRKEQ